jgi:hypothetical protein
MPRKSTSHHATRTRPAAVYETPEQLIGLITADAKDDVEQLEAFRHAFANELKTPDFAELAGYPIQVLAFQFEGNARQGVTALCVSTDRGSHMVSAADLEFAEGTKADAHISAYRQWIKLAEYPARAVGTGSEREIELAVLSFDALDTHCRVLPAGRVIDIRGSALEDVVPGEIISLKPRRQWQYSGKSYLSGDIVATRIDAAALGLTPLKLNEAGAWEPEHYFGDDEVDPILKPIVALGPRPEFEMEQVLPGWDWKDPATEPIGRFADLMERGDRGGAYKILMQLCESDLRCLDAHAHLGLIAFEELPAHALRHYEVGVRIGELSLPADFDGVLSWFMIDNRPFLRCLQGYGLCLWRLKRHKEALAVFQRMLRLCPTDNLGVRFVIPDLRAKRSWENRSER